MNVTATSTLKQRQVLDDGSPLPPWTSRVIDSGRGLPHSKTLSRSLPIMFLLVVLGFLFVGCSKSDSAAQPKTLYTCGMHPQVIQNHPGNCPICGMKLTPVRKQGEPAQAENISTIAVDPVTIQNMGVRTTEIIRGPLRRSIRTVGTVDYSETALADVTTKFKGWIERLYVDATGQQVHKGDPLFEIYSPELYSAEVEYLLALNQQNGDVSGAAALRETATSKLKFFDISDAQIAELEKNGKPSKTLRILAPIDGFVIEKRVVEGMMAEPGMKLYRLADLGLVWVYAEVYEQDLPFIRLGQEAIVKLSYLPDREFRGRVTYIYPNVNEKTRTARVRMEFHNPGYFLKPGMFATITVSSELKPSVLLVPDSAVLRSGEKNTVFVALDGGKFEPRTVSLGQPAADDRYEVLAGLREGERVVTSGQFMLDSESQLREAIQKMLEPAAASAAHDEAAETNAPMSETAATDRPAAERQRSIYICPMPEHVSIEYQHAGKCPICGMALVPVSEAALRKIQPGGKVLYYTCPMPEHSDVHEEKPGKCPKCNMTLIPVMEQARLTVQEEAKSASPAAPPVTLYTCPMASHAHIVTDKPGKCAECEMQLVPTSTVKHGKIAEEKWLKQHKH